MKTNINSDNPQNNAPNTAVCAPNASAVGFDSDKAMAEDARADAQQNDVNEGKKKKRKLSRFELDLSARFYPVISTKKAQSLYCMAAILKDDVDIAVLEDAANQIMDRFPTYKVRLRKGYSWHFFEENTEKVKVFEIDNVMLRPIDPNVTNGYLFRISCGSNKVKLDMFHALTDGNGAMLFLKTLLMRYRELQGVVFDDGEGIDILQTPLQEEIEDSFTQNYKPIPMSEMNLKGMLGGVPMRLTGTPVDDGYLISMGTAKITDILKIAKEMGVSFTSYIAGLIAYTITELEQSEQPIVIMIPVNLRKMFPSKTLRNFVTFIRIVIKPKDCVSLEDFVRVADEQLKEKSSKSKMEAFISTTVRAQANFIMRIVPLFLKTFFIRLGKFFTRSRQTIIFSNLGRIDVPEKLGLDKFVFHMNASKYNAQNIGAVSVGENVTFAFTRAIKETTLTRGFFDNLQKQGVAIDTKEESAYGDGVYYYTDESIGKNKADKKQNKNN